MAAAGNLFVGIMHGAAGTLRGSAMLAPPRIAMAVSACDLGLGIPVGNHVSPISCPRGKQLEPRCKFLAADCPSVVNNYVSAAPVVLALDRCHSSISARHW